MPHMRTPPPPCVLHLSTGPYGHSDVLGHTQPPPTRYRLFLFIRKTVSEILFRHEARGLRELKSALANTGAELSTRRAGLGARSFETFVFFKIGMHVNVPLLTNKK